MVMFVDSVTGLPLDSGIGCTNDAAHVTDGVSGIARGRFITVTSGTLPVLATSGVASWAAPGVRGVVIDSVRWVSTVIPLDSTNWRIRYLIDSPNDAYSSLVLPVAEPTSSATSDVDQVGSFNVAPVFQAAALDANRVTHIILPQPVFIDVTDPITRLDFIHNLGTGVVIQLGIRAVEAL